MTLTFLGTGSAFTVGGNWQSNLFIENEKGNRLLIDAGSDVRHAMYEQGLSYRDFCGPENGIYLSHCHGDHAQGLEYFGFTSMFDPTVKKPNLFLSKSLVQQVWENGLQAAMGSIQGDIVNLQSYFEIHPVEANGAFEWSGVTFRLVQTVHIMNGFAIVPSYGLLFKLGDKKIFFTGDTQHAPNQIQDFYKMADIIFQDCETSPYKSGVHANYKDLLTLSDEIKAKMWLYHYQPGALPDAIADGFAGFVVKGQKFSF
ncbi:MAG: metallo-beta-lactamase [Sulfuricurvum sp. PC08-66]|nr:MAG: metallo-beta-lactamase [Sulfuricurvum sp. PC08-66]